MVLDHVVCSLNDTRLQWTWWNTSIKPYIYQLYDGFECIYILCRKLEIKLESLINSYFCMEKEILE